MSHAARFAAAAVVLATLACSVSVPSFMGLTGSGNVISLDQDFSDFDRVEISTAFKATITQGEAYSVVVRIDDNLQPYLRVTQDGRTLSVGIDTDRVFGFAFGKTTLEVDITLPSLASLELSGASHATLVDIFADSDLKLEASGASTIEGDLQAGTVDVSLSGASTCTLSGGASTLSVDASGASTASLSDFPVVDADVVVSGASSASVNASGTLDAQADGASHVGYSGNPTLGDVNVSGASSVEPE